LLCDTPENRAAEEGEHYAPQERVHDDATEKRDQQTDAVRERRTSHQLRRLLLRIIAVLHKTLPRYIAVVPYDN